ncbi:MAG: isopentenyl-diphosphate Delta-isomerase [Bacteroidales bacterium]
MLIEYVVLVNESDEETGFMEKMEAHEKAILHRAFSVFLFNSQNEFLLQRRAFGKYHSPGLWTNTCCSHPRKDELAIDAAKRRLREEMGMQSEIREIFSFVYKADVGQGLTEHEFDHVFAGFTDDCPLINPEEVAEWKYLSLDELKQQMQAEPEQFTVWFRIAFAEVEKFLLSAGIEGMKS